MIITTSDFTDAARRLAKGAPIELWSRRDRSRFPLLIAKLSVASKLIPSPEVMVDRF
ncbi:MAG: restriction endonuclease [Candidatus Bathyarchaeia archaeon]